MLTRTRATLRSKTQSSHNLPRESIKNKKDSLHKRNSAPLASHKRHIMSSTSHVINPEQVGSSHHHHASHAFSRRRILPTMFTPTRHFAIANRRGTSNNTTTTTTDTITQTETRTSSPLLRFGIDLPVSHHDADGMASMHVRSQLLALMPQHHLEETLESISSPSSSTTPIPRKLHDRPGLYGIRGITHPRTLLDLYIDKENEIKLRARTLLQQDETSIDSLQIIDDMSKLLCDIADFSDTVSKFHLDPSWRSAGDRLSRDGYNLMNQWSNHPIVLLVIYNMIRSEKIWSALNLEQRRILLDLAGRMSMSDVIDQDDYNSIMPEIPDIEDRFIQQQQENNRDMVSLNNVNITQHDEDILHHYAHYFRRGPDGHIRFLSSPHVSDYISQDITSRPLRRELYKHSGALQHKHLPHLETLLRYRHIIAIAQGYPSHAHCATSSLMTKSPSVPIDILSRFADSLENARMEEYKLMHRITQYIQDQVNNAPDTIHSTTNNMNKPLGSTAKGATFLNKASQLLSTFGGSGSNNTAINTSKNNGLHILDTIIDNDHDYNSIDNTKLYPYDIPFALKQVDKQSNIDAVTEYCRLDSVLQGYGLILNVLNLRAEVHAIKQGEGWSQNDARSDYSDMNTLYNEYSTNELYNNDISNSTYHYAVHEKKAPGLYSKLEDLHNNTHLISDNIVKLHLIDKENDLLMGILYLDLYQRPGKNGDAQHLITSGRVSHDHITSPSLTYPELLAKHKENEHNTGIKRTIIEGFDLPVSIVSLSINKQDSNALIKERTRSLQQDSHTQLAINSGQRSIFTLHKNEVNTKLSIRSQNIQRSQSWLQLPCLKYNEMHSMFHELGHATHSLLSRTQFQHFAGSRCEMDFAETPSTLFEMMIEDPRFVRLFASHHIYDTPMPSSISRAITIKELMMPAYTMSKSTVNSLIDLRLHGPPLLPDIDTIFPKTLLDSDEIQQIKQNAMQFAQDNGGLRNLPHDHASPLATTQITHLLYRRYLNIDLSPYGDGVSLTGERKLSKLPDTLDIVPHASNTHLAFYGGFYYTYTVCKALATLIKSAVFDDLLEPGSSNFKQTLQRYQIEMLTKQRDELLNTLSSSSSSHDDNDNNNNVQQQKQQITEIENEINNLNNILNCNISNDSNNNTDTDNDLSSSSSSSNKRHTMTSSSSPSRGPTLGNQPNNGKSINFDTILPTVDIGTRFRSHVIEKGGSQVGLDIVADLINIPGESLKHDHATYIFDDNMELKDEYSQRVDPNSNNNDKTPDPDHDNETSSDNDNEEYEYNQKLHHIHDTIQVAIQHMGWRSMSPSERQMTVLDLAFSNLTATVIQQSRQGIQLVNKRLGFKDDNNNNIKQ